MNYLCDDSECSLSGGIKLHGEFEPITYGKILIGRADGQNDGALVAAVVAAHFKEDLFDILSLAFDGDTCDAWQVDQRQIGAIRRIDGHDDGVGHDI